MVFEREAYFTWFNYLYLPKYLLKEHSQSMILTYRKYSYKEQKIEDNIVIVIDSAKRHIIRLQKLDISNWFSYLWIYLTLRKWFLGFWNQWLTLKKSESGSREIFLCDFKQQNGTFLISDIDLSLFWLNFFDFWKRKLLAIFN